MMITVNNITVPLDMSKEELLLHAIKKSGLSKKQVTGYRVERRSVDARRKNVQFNYSISLTNVFCDVIGHITSSSSLIDYEPFKQNVFTATIGYKIF